ncbi:o-succinylbenzoate--CoA ligase [Vagococcus intermedius]|uniref:2-succinylbenzoate--CoA ligase n=1 Tax=Vagococcus intermedius TaxID=2991418 RepID=A0AAF0CVE3_9ENTE|nr:o-succinylbenzoate--CoA ligase [Vagococcus intermedius]WEG73655.1 o-succinylbenzoate--CoA ligase [Vagococcus intermedius]WEG75739.1 o-succinylbenzoate--CoA ligase [Vagococcus intermedius]
MENWLLKRARLTPNKIGLVFENNNWTFSELKMCANTLLNQLYHHKQSLSRVAVLGSNAADFYHLLLALHLGNIETIILNNRLTAQEIKQQTTIAQPDLIIFEEKFTEKLTLSTTDYDSLSLESLKQINSDTALSFSETTIDLSQTTTIMFTSGTTGTPKAVRQTYENHWSSAIGSALNLGLSQDDTWLMTVPLFHISGYSMLIKGLIYGQTVCLIAKFNPDTIINTLTTYHVTHLSLVPTMLEVLLNNPSFRRLGSQLKCLLLGGAALSIDTLEHCIRLNLPVIQSFGMTETASQVVALNHHDARKKIGSSGLPQLAISLKIADTVEPYSTGEILIKGPNVTPGYLNSPLELTEDGYFKTGDLGYLDNEGFLFVSGRQKELIISGGENIYPLEVEYQLKQLPMIKEAAVIGEQDTYWGERVVAYLVVTDIDDFNTDALSLLSKKIAAYKCPKTYYLVKELPKNAIGKLIKRELPNQEIIRLIQPTR